MPRHKKQGLNYFPHDVDMSSDEKVQLMEAECGLIGYAVLNKILERIYRQNYYIECSEKFIKLLSKTNNIKIDECKQIINVCINEDIFNKKLYKKYNILTSIGIQKRFFDAVSRRIDIECIEAFLLIPAEIIENVNITYINVNKNGKKDNKSTHSIVKESIVKESIGITGDMISAQWNENKTLYLEKYPYADHEIEIQDMKRWIKDNPKKAAKRSDANLFIHKWFGRCSNNRSGQKKINLSFEQKAIIEEYKEKLRGMIKDNEARKENGQKPYYSDDYIKAEENEIRKMENGIFS